MYARRKKEALDRARSRHHAPSKNKTKHKHKPKPKSNRVDKTADVLDDFPHLARSDPLQVKSSRQESASLALFEFSNSHRDLRCIQLLSDFESVCESICVCVRWTS